MVFLKQGTCAIGPCPRPNNVQSDDYSDCRAFVSNHPRAAIASLEDDSDSRLLRWTLVNLRACFQDRQNLRRLIRKDHATHLFSIDSDVAATYSQHRIARQRS